MKEVTATGMFQLATGKRSLGGLVPFWRIIKEGDFNPGDGFTVGEPVGLTGTKNTSLRYLGRQVVDGVLCGLFEYTSTTNSMGNDVRSGPHGKMWLDPTDGIYRLVVDQDDGQYVDRTTGGQGPGTRTLTVWRYRR